ncbi:MAG: hypothetical protein ACOVO2_05535 [Emticicia sp.]
MANTYSQIYIHIIFAVQGRENVIKKAWKNELYAYMGGIIKNLGSNWFWSVFSTNILRLCRYLKHRFTGA